MAETKYIIRPHVDILNNPLRHVLIIGATKSGKSYLMRNFMIRNCCNLPKKILIFSENYQDINWEIFDDLINPKTGKRAYVRGKNLAIGKFNEEVFLKFIKQREEANRAAVKLRRKKGLKINPQEMTDSHLIIFDDMAGKNLKALIRIMSGLITRIRHLGIHAWFSIQYYSLCSRVIRTNCEVIYFKRPASNSDEDCLYKEISCPFGPRVFSKMIRKLTKNYGTVVYDRTEGKLEYIPGNF